MFESVWEGRKENERKPAVVSAASLAAQRALESQRLPPERTRQYSHIYHSDFKVVIITST